MTYWLLHPVLWLRRLLAGWRLLDAATSSPSIVWRAWDRVPLLLIDVSEGGGLAAYGLSGGDVRGRDLRGIHPVGDPIRDACERVLTTGRPVTVPVTVSPQVVFGPAAQASERQYLMHVSRVRQGRRWGLVGVSFDVTGLTDELTDSLEQVSEARAYAAHMESRAQVQRLRADLATREVAALIDQRKAERSLADVLSRN